MKKIPIIINNFNRLEYLQQQVDWLLRTGLTNIHVIDNASTYPPLLRYYNRIPATVYRLDRNVGHEALWRTHLYQRFRRNFYVYTDPDVLPTENTPANYLFHFMDILKRYPEIDKVGFGLKTDDLPDSYPQKNEVIQWENSLLMNEVEPALYKSQIDTTFALYRPGKSFQCWETTLRTGEPFLLRHMPWYEDYNQLTVESRYYLETVNKDSSWYNSLKGIDNRYKSQA